MNNSVALTDAEIGTEVERTLVIHRHFAAPREVVYRAWTEPQELLKWWGPEGCQGKLCELDLRPGGVWRTSMMMPDGNEIFVGGTYREIVAPERLAFTWAWETDGEPGHETLIIIDFQERDGGTEMVFTQRLFQSIEQCTKHNEGWTSSFNRLQAVVTGG